MSRSQATCSPALSRPARRCRRSERFLRSSAFLKGAIGVWIWLVLCEGMMIASNAVMESGADIALFRFIHENIDCMPKTAEALTVQAILFGAGLLIYVVCTLLACRVSIKRYEKVSVQ